MYFQEPKFWEKQRDGGGGTHAPNTSHSDALAHPSCPGYIISLAVVYLLMWMYRKEGHEGINKHRHSICQPLCMFQANTLEIVLSGELDLGKSALRSLAISDCPDNVPRPT